MGILRDRMIEEMKLRNFSSADAGVYLYAVTRTRPRSSCDRHHGDVGSVTCQGSNPHSQPSLLHPTP